MLHRLPVGWSSHLVGFLWWLLLQRNTAPAVHAIYNIYRHEAHPEGTRACLGDSVYTYKAGIALINMSSCLSVKGHAPGDDVISIFGHKDQSYTSIPFHRPL
jgi:hypothetical protein